MNTFDRLVASFERCGLTHAAAEQAAAGRGVSVAEARRRVADAERAVMQPVAQDTTSSTAVERAQAASLARIGVAETRTLARPTTIRERDLLGREVSPITGRPILPYQTPLSEVLARYGSR